ncbi:hypothetical protein KORDIASMS9_02832 [Kordia sp. SMS9]|uniref:hypothetical protein n=1 Tax=Kordia sp. SMS9 TaxID=2282170 RepID=UPI000E0D2E61|nr:hypothetical protein [Kordia sp. SMS9]AXG70592.1 hypothetical protein KORDIASMS9_02832 [Kordia sp. SMS9]
MGKLISDYENKKNANSILIDGFTLHVACLHDITPKEYLKLNDYAKKTFNTLIQSLVLHEKISVGSDVVNPKKRFPELFNLFGDCIQEINTINQNDTSLFKKEIVRDYNFNKEEFLKLNREKSYEDELTNFVQKHFFENNLEPKVEILKRSDTNLFKIFIQHQKLRVRMYNVEAVHNGISYLPSPFRVKLSEIKEMKKTLAMDLLNSLNEEIRVPIIKSLAEDTVYRHLPLDISTPPLLKFIIKEGGNQSILKSALEIRNLKIAKGFRNLCNDLLTAEELRIITKIRAEIEDLKSLWKNELHQKNHTKSNDINLKVYGISAKTPITWKTKFPRKAYLFMYKMVNAI